VRNELPLELAEYRNALASAYNNRGLALEGLGEPEDLSAAISSFKQAIALRKPLLSIEHRTGLVTAYYNCAAAQQMLGGAKNLQEAIASCNHAVAVGKELPLEAPACRAALAGAFANLGAAQASLGGPDNLRDAITSYGESIALQKELSLEVPNYRHDLAQSYYNRGATQQNLEGRENLLAAINSYDEAIALIFSITMVSTAWADVACSAFLAKATASQTLGDLESNNSRYTIFHQQAINAAKKGLEICRQWRQRGEYGRRNDMEKLLAIGSLSCYQVQPHSLGSFLLENLDPDRSLGAAPENESMQTRAFTLMLLYAGDLKRDAALNRGDLIDLMRQCAAQSDRLETIFLRYLGGSIAATRSRAEIWIKSGDFDRADKEWSTFLSRQPDNLEALEARAKFYHARARHGRSQDAFANAVQRYARSPGDPTPDSSPIPNVRKGLTAFLRVIVLAGQNFVQLSEDEQVNTIRWAVSVAQEAAEIYIPRRLPEAITIHTVRSVDNCFTAAIRWLDSVIESLAQNSASQPLQERLRDLQGSWANIKQEWLAAGIDQSKSAAKLWETKCIQAEIERAERAQHLTKQLTEFIAELNPQIEAVLASYKYEFDESETDPPSRGRLEEMIVDSLVSRLKMMLGSLSECEQQKGMRKAIEAIGIGAWNLLGEDVKRNLAFALRTYGEPKTGRFVGIAFGLVVEGELLNRYYGPVRTIYLKKSHPNYVSNNDKFGERLHHYFVNGKGLSLGELIGGFTQVVYPNISLKQRVKRLAEDGPVFVACERYLKETFNMSELQKHELYKPLDCIQATRNRCAHVGRDVLPEVLVGAHTCLLGPGGFLPVFLNSLKGVFVNPV
jgi:hypothetical protein